MDLHPRQALHGQPGAGVRRCYLREEGKLRLARREGRSQGAELDELMGPTRQLELDVAPTRRRGAALLRAPLADDQGCGPEISLALEERREAAVRNMPLAPVWRHQ